jgi:hypothetical protein
VVRALSTALRLDPKLRAVAVRSKVLSEMRDPEVRKLLFPGGAAPASAPATVPATAP